MSGFVFSLIALLSLIAVPPLSKACSTQKSDRTKSHYEISFHTKKCPDCVEIIKLEAKVCPFCRHRFSEDEINSQLAIIERESHSQEETTKKIGKAILNEKDIESLRNKFSNYSTDKLKKMKRRGSDSWRAEALQAIDEILKDRG
ncbi:zinc ribbon domain-containing protein [Melioribacter sp. OK-6-Me]|uniref:zinc ribbon domain-containing protein n=1 Tax=unclassified Melioribacter TaxID=2627329 RepID=UPI003ED92344